MKKRIRKINRINFIIISPLTLFWLYYFCVISHLLILFITFNSFLLVAEILGLSQIW